MLYSTRMDRGGNPAQVTELLQGALQTAVRLGFDHHGFLTETFGRRNSANSNLTNFITIKY